MRFRLRTLMLVVAGLALLCAGVVKLPPVAGLLFVAAVGPSVGAIWAGLRYRPGRIDPIAGATAGGLVQAALFLVLAVGLAAASHGAAGWPWGLWSILRFGLTLLTAHLIIGVCAGSFVFCCLLAFLKPSDAADPSEASQP